MTPEELKLVPIEDLQKEIASRCDGCIIITERSEDAGPPILRFYSSHGSVAGVGLARTAEGYFLKHLLDSYELDEDRDKNAA